MRNQETQNNPTVLRASRLSKTYSLGTSRSMFRSRGRSDRPRQDLSSFAALSEISFSLQAGETLGLVGRNGSGKSTLLGIMGGVIQPTAGHIDTSRRVVSLLDLGVGFHPLETGRQNAESLLSLYLRIPRHETRCYLPAVEAFAGLGDRMTDPIRSYSDGMRLRLAFATISVLRPEILIADEVLVVGDAEFQRRCENWFDGFLGEGGTLVLCSHDLNQIDRLCRRSIWLESGRIAALGETADVIARYRQSMGAGEGAETDSEAAGFSHTVGEIRGLPFEVVRLELADEGGSIRTQFSRNATWQATIDVRAPAGIPNVFVGVTTDEFVPIYGVASDMDRIVPERLPDGIYRFHLRFFDSPLLPGSYRLRAHALDETGTRLYDTVQVSFQIDDSLGTSDTGLVEFPYRFTPRGSA